MLSNFAKVMDLIFINEGGYAERDSEPGGAVNMGVSMVTFIAWRLFKKQPIPNLLILR